MRRARRVTAAGLAAAVLLMATGPVRGDPPGPPPAAEPLLHTFKRIQLSDRFWAEGVAVADVNRDGHKDVIAGPYWYEGPDFTRRHPLYPTHQSFTRAKEDGTTETVDGFDGATGWSDDFHTYAWDINGDGWPDILTVGFPGKEAVWYENPGRDGLAGDRPWKRHLAFNAVGNESPLWVDLFRNGRPVLLFMQGDVLGYGEPDWSHPGDPWTFHPISTPLPIVQDMRARYESAHGGRPFPPMPYCHGLGCGDVNGDGRLDILEMEGWWEQPASLQGNPVWKLHKWPFLKERPPPSAVPSGAPIDYYNWPYALRAAQMYIYDVNGDGRPDLISSLDAHGYGLGWFEQLPERDASGEIQFRPHLVMGSKPGDNRYGVSFTELHALNLADVDGDGLQDLVTGKRKWAEGRNGPDPETNAPSLLYWFKLVRHPDRTVEYVPYLIDDHSGVGEQVWVGDIDGDGRPDIAVSNKNGTFVFIQEVRPVSQREWDEAQPKALPGAPVDRPQ
jgi:hypothetical protein